MSTFELSKVVVIGAGTMGQGIAQWFAQQGVETFLTDQSAEQRQRALGAIHASWEKLAEKGKLTARQVEGFKGLLRVRERGELPRDAALVIEAIIEDLAIKRSLLRELDAVFGPATVFASNTSSFPIREVAAELSPARRQRCLGLHFFNPATLMKLVEIIAPDASTATVAAELETWFRQHGKEPAVCADTPGFIVNRVARGFYGEALRIVGAEDAAKVREVDHLLREVGGFKMGPFELMDLIGVDVNLAVTTSVWEAMGRSPRMAPHPLQQSVVAAGRHGRKTKRGFYEYP